MFGIYIEDFHVLRLVVDRELKHELQVAVERRREDSMKGMTDEAQAKQSRRVAIKLQTGRQRSCMEPRTQDGIHTCSAIMHSNSGDWPKGEAITTLSYVST